jgi:hypothetical protein
MASKPINKNLVFKKIVSVYFYVGVNVIGLPLMIEHIRKIYRYENGFNYKKY